ncbi:MAG: hypothetical protein ACOCQD_03045 [archaeon]
MTNDSFQLTLENQLDIESALIMMEIVVSNRLLTIPNIELLMIAKKRLEAQIENIKLRGAVCDHEDIREFCKGSK